MKINWFSNAPWGISGYSNQTKIFVPRLKKLGHEMTITAFYGLEGGLLNMDGVPIYPRAFHPYGMDIMSANATHANADIVISLIDVWVLEPSMMAEHTRWVPWFPIDSFPIVPSIAERAAKAYERIVFSKYGCKMMDQAGLDYLYVPHGTETKEWYYPEDRTEARKKLSLPKDKFILGMVAANKGSPSRKAFQQQLEAFTMLKAKHKDVAMYLHTGMAQHGENQGENIPAFCDYLGLKWAMLSPDNDGSEDVLFCDQYSNTVGFFGPDYMRAVYNSIDFLSIVSQGEGFGIPLIEAQACGCPVITGDWTSMSELCFSGWKVDIRDAIPFWNPLKVYQYIPNPRSIYDLYMKAYLCKGQPGYRERAREGALAYDADLVAEKYWKPVLEKIEAKIVDEKKWVPLGKALNPDGHKWYTVGLYNPDGSMDIPDINTGDALRQYPDGKKDIIPGGFTNPLGLKFTEPDGLEWILMREFERDYDIPYTPDHFADIVYGEGLKLNEQSIVIDIGAHVGVISMSLAKKYGCKVYAYEPEPHNYERLVKNIFNNKLGCIHTENIAVSHDGRDVTIVRDGDNSGGGNIYGENGSPIKSKSFEFILRMLLQKWDYIDLLKIDCEGAEYEILQGADLSKIKAIRGEFHGPKAQVLLDEVKAKVPDTKVTIQG
jgi:FkbM family methyltransferase